MNTPVKLKSLSFDNELKQAQRGDHFVIYSPGVSGWVRYAVGKVSWPYIFPMESSMPSHVSHVQKLEKADGTAYER